MIGMAQKLKEFADRRKTKRERITEEVGKEDFLLSQIDEFREKAKQLHGLLATKANRVQELHEVVTEREETAKELSDMIEKRRDAAERMVSGVGEQISVLVSKVDARLNELNETFAERLAENAVNCAEQNEEVRAMIAEQNEKLTETVNGLNGKFEKIRDEICEKVHNEDVKCYRNMQTLIEESDRKLDAVKEQVAQLEPMKNTVKVITVLALLNLAGTAAVILFAMGLI